MYAVGICTHSTMQQHTRSYLNHPKSHNKKNISRCHTTCAMSHKGGICDHCFISGKKYVRERQKQGCLLRLPRLRETAGVTKIFLFFLLGMEMLTIYVFFSGLKINNHSMFQLRISLASPEEIQLQDWEREWEVSPFINMFSGSSIFVRYLGIHT